MGTRRFDRAPPCWRACQLELDLVVQHSDTGRCAAMAGGAAGLRPALLATLAVVIDYAAQQASSQVRLASLLELIIDGSAGNCLTSAAPALLCLPQLS